MSVWFAILLGLIQGVTEFLPVSSSAHLCLLQQLFPGQLGEESDLLFDVLLHMATLAAVCGAYRQDVRGILLEVWHMGTNPFRRRENRSAPQPSARRLLLLLVLGTLPLGLAVLGEEWVERLSRSGLFIGIALICTGFLLFLSDYLPKGRKDLGRTGPGDALLIGLTQALAVLPGLSRSGSTVTAGLARGLDRETAVKYSFLLSVPAILGANLLKLVEAVRCGIAPDRLPACLLGMGAAAVSGWLSIRVLRSLTRRGRFSAFRWYCWGLGLAVILKDILLKG